MIEVHMQTAVVASSSVEILKCNPEMRAEVQVVAAQVNAFRLRDACE